MMYSKTFMGGEMKHNFYFTGVSVNLKGKPSAQLHVHVSMAMDYLLLASLGALSHSLVATTLTSSPAEKAGPMAPRVVVRGVARISKAIFPPRECPRTPTYAHAHCTNIQLHPRGAD